MSVFAIEVKDQTTGQTQSFGANISKSGEIQTLDSEGNVRETSGHASTTFEVRTHFVKLWVQNDGAEVTITLGSEAFTRFTEIFFEKFSTVQGDQYWTDDNRQEFVKDFLSRIMDLVENPSS